MQNQLKILLTVYPHGTLSKLLVIHAGFLLIMPVVLSLTWKDTHSRD